MVIKKRGNERMTEYMKGVKKGGYVDVDVSSGERERELGERYLGDMDRSKGRGKIIFNAFLW